jgi:glycosyltransferase involved in cell wall biosynthesis
MKILIITPHYLPGFKAGGPIESIKSIVANLHGKLEFDILTKDRDLGDNQSYLNIKTEEWIENSNCQIMYLNPSKFNSIFVIMRLIAKNKYDALYLPSSFSLVTIKLLFLRKLGFLKKLKIIVSPRGEYSAGALKLKKIKKKVFLVLARLIGLYQNIIWHATTRDESKLIIKTHDSNVQVKVAENLKEIIIRDKFLIKNDKELKLVFAGRISPMKNLNRCLDELTKVDYKNIVFDIIGPIEDEEFWNECRLKISRLKNIQVNYIGCLENDIILQKLSDYHFLFLPTLGENFGHIILESLMARTPLIISDRTPWRQLNKINIGWDISLSCDIYPTIKYCYNMENKEYQKMMESVKKYVDNYDQSLMINNTWQLFNGKE